MNYLFGNSLPRGFDKNIRTYSDVSDETEYPVFQYGIFKIKAGSEKLESLTEKLYERLFQAGRITEALLLQELADKLNIFAQKTRSSDRDGLLIRDVLETISRTEENLASERFAWISSDTFNLGESYDNILSRIEKSHFFGPDLRLEVQRAGESAFRRFKNTLKIKESVLTGPLLKVKDGELVMALSPSTLALKADLETLLKQPFMVMEPVRGQRIGQLPPGTRFSSWNTDILDEAVRIFEPYENYMKKRGGRIASTGLQKTIISDTAKSNLERKVRDMIAQARRLEPVSDGLGNRPRETFDDQLDETNIFLEIRNFKEAEKFFNRLLFYFRKLGLADAEKELLNILSGQSFALLERVDDFLSHENIYRIRGEDFSWWNGQETPSLAAYDVVDEKELEYHLRLQRERIRHLAYEYAEPLITFHARRNQAHVRANPGRGKLFSNGKSEQEQVLFKWKRILSALEDYENKKPANSVTVLEKFILFDMNDINETNYFKKISQKDLNERSSDIFLQRRNDLRRKLYERCQEFAASRIITEYAEIRDFFDRELKGRFPFSEIKGQAVFSEANPESIRDFYSLFDEDAATLKDVLRLNKQFGISGDQTFAFLDQMEKVREFFVSYLEAGKAEGEEVKQEIPVLDFNVRFRVNQANEFMANTIIDWNLTVGSQVFRYGDEKLAGRWQFGDPVSLSFRWAKNAMDYPYFARQPAEGKITENRTVKYEFNTQWSLIHFLRTCAFSLKDTEPHTLEFVIDTVRAGSESEKNGKSQAKVFIRLVVSTSDKAKKVLKMPYFPRQAPELKWSSGNYTELKLPIPESLPDATENASPKEK